MFAVWNINFCICHILQDRIKHLYCLFVNIVCVIDFPSHTLQLLNNKTCSTFITILVHYYIDQPTLREREREMFYLTTHSTHFIYGYMASDIWLRTILIVRKETCCCHIGYSYRLTARVLLYAPSHRQDNTYHGLCYTSRGAQAGTRNS